MSKVVKYFLPDTQYAAINVSKYNACGTREKSLFWLFGLYRKIRQRRIGTKMLNQNFHVLAKIYLNFWQHVTFSSGEGSSKVAAAEGMAARLLCSVEELYLLSSIARGYPSTKRNQMITLSMEKLEFN